MAKRTRGGTRPGQRRPLQRTTASRPAPPTAVTTPRPTGLTPEEEARAAELEARIVAEERSAEEAQRRTRDRRRESTSDAAPIRAGSSSLAVQAAEEYAYVARDVRRIVIVGGSLIALLLGLWIVTQVTGFTLG